MGAAIVPTYGATIMMEEPNRAWEPKQQLSPSARYSARTRRSHHEQNQHDFSTVASRETDKHQAGAGLGALKWWGRGRVNLESLKRHMR